MLCIDRCSGRTETMQWAAYICVCIWRNILYDKVQLWNNRQNIKTRFGAKNVSLLCHTILYLFWQLVTGCAALPTTRMVFNETVPWMLSNITGIPMLHCRYKCPHKDLAPMWFALHSRINFKEESSSTSESKATNGVDWWIRCTADPPSLPRWHTSLIMSLFVEW